MGNNVTAVTYTRFMRSFRRIFISVFDTPVVDFYSYFSPVLYIYMYFSFGDYFDLRGTVDRARGVQAVECAAVTVFRINSLMKNENAQYFYSEDAIVQHL